MTWTTETRNFRLQKMNPNLGILLQISWYLSLSALFPCFGGRGKKNLVTELKNNIVLFLHCMFRIFIYNFRSRVFLRHSLHSDN